jgi:hypothetical protein
MAETLTEAQLQQIRDRLAATTPGEWHLDDPYSSRVYVSPSGGLADDSLFVCYVNGDGSEAEDRLNAAFIAAAHQDVPLLLAALAERDGIIHDMQQDKDAYHRGRESAFGEVLALLRRYRGENMREKDTADHGYYEDTAIGRIQASHQLIDAVLGLAGLCPGEKPLPLPPDAARARADRLVQALREISQAFNLVSIREIARKALAAPA